MTRDEVNTNETIIFISQLIRCPNIVTAVEVSFCFNDSLNHILINIQERHVTYSTNHSDDHNLAAIRLYDNM